MSTRDPGMTRAGGITLTAEVSHVSAIDSVAHRRRYLYSTGRLEAIIHGSSISLIQLIDRTSPVHSFLVFDVMYNTHR